MADIEQARKSRRRKTHQEAPLEANDGTAIVDTQQPGSSAPREKDTKASNDNLDYNVSNDEPIGPKRGRRARRGKLHANMIMPHGERELDAPAFPESPYAPGYRAGCGPNR